MIYTLDENYTIEEYNKIVNTLYNKGIPFNEYISTKNYKFFIETELEPFCLDYREVNKSFSYFLVSKTKFLQESERVKYTRRNEHQGKNALKLAYNDAFTELKDEYVYFFHLTNLQKAKLLSKEIGKIWYFGKYYNSRYFVFLSNNQYLTNFVKIDDILASGDVLDAEMQLYYQAFQRQDRLKKFSYTPYFNNGDYFKPKILAKFFQNTNTDKVP